MRPVTFWHSSLVETMQITVERGRFVQLLVDVGTPDKHDYRITELKFPESGGPVLTSHLQCLSWGVDDEGRAGKETT